MSNSLVDYLYFSQIVNIKKKFFNIELKFFKEKYSDLSHQSNK